MAYSTADGDKLFRLLPVHIRERDEAEGGPLKALLHLIEQQADAIDGDIRQLQHDAFRLRHDLEALLRHRRTRARSVDQAR